MGQWGVLMDMSTILLMIMSRGKDFQTQIEIVRMAKKTLLLLCVRMAGVSSLNLCILSRVLSKVISYKISTNI